MKLDIGGSAGGNMKLDIIGWGNWRKYEIRYYRWRQLVEI
jgi:hypothetical protein